MPNYDNIQNVIDNLISELGIEMVLCPAGSFMMGSPEREYNKQPEEFFDALFGTREILQNEELGRFDNELQHWVTISSEFLIGKFPVTQKLYETVMGNNPSNFKGENNPVECVSWDDANNFCNKLNRKFASKLPKGLQV